MTAYASLRDRITGLVRDILKAEGRPTEVPSDRRLTDLGLASMDMVSLMLALEAEFDFTIPASDITPETFLTVETIERMVVRLLPQTLAA